MLIERFYDDDLSQASYLVADQSTGEAVVLDPRRDVEEYLAFAAAHGLRIVAVAETHIHADYLSGTRELAHAADAVAMVPGQGGHGWEYGYAARRLHDGDTIEVGAVRLRVLHTPGHTPEHIVLAVTDTCAADHEGFLFSGDLVFVGDVGRPDLLDRVADGVETWGPAARMLFESLARVLAELPDHAQVFPAHGSGSPCGKNLGALASSTIGYERRVAWWAPYVEAGDVDGFVERLLDGQPDAHAYFARMKRDNRDGPALRSETGPVAELDAVGAQALMDAGAVLVDTRAAQDVRAGAVLGSLAISGHGRTAAWGAWALDPELEPVGTPLVLVADDEQHARTLRDHLVRVGIDGVAGFIRDLDGFALTPTATVAPDALPAEAVLVDVRGPSEHASGHVPGSRRIGAGRVLAERAALPAERPVVVYCQSGARSLIAAQALRHHGIAVTELEGSYAGWRATCASVDGRTH
ncbi:MBL fold metallo-hydrolase [Brachybacterium sp. AOP25-B2-12]|uniref:MBL fold metallo-hydrolase n=1 Tax=Brachybacterium sp. AOP25-B2-12 TaxID=3457710 RepID=UPI0040334557